MLKKIIVLVILILILVGCSDIEQTTKQVDQNVQVNQQKTVNVDNTKDDTQQKREEEKLKQKKEEEEKLKKLIEQKNLEIERIKRQQEYDLYLRSLFTYYSNPNSSFGDNAEIRYKVADLTNDGKEDLAIFFDNGVMANMYSKLVTYNAEKDDIVELVRTTIGTEYFEAGIHFSWSSHQQDPNNPQSGDIFSFDENGKYYGEYSNYDEFLKRHKKQIEGQIPVTFENSIELGKMITQIPKEYVITEDNPVVEELSEKTLESFPDYPKLVGLVSMFAELDTFSSKYDMTDQLVGKMSASMQYLNYNIPSEMIEFSVGLVDKSVISDLVKKVFATDITLRPDFANWKGNEDTTETIPEGKAAISIYFNAGVPRKMSVLNKLSKLKDGTFYIEATEYSYDNYDFSNNNINMFEPKMSEIEYMGLKPLGKVHAHLKMVDGYYVINWVQSY